MDDLNYHHLRYFHAVATEGSVAAAAERLYVSQPTVSGQLKALETQLGEKLFQRRGRGLELTELGRVVLGYADEIFATGRELMDAVRGIGTGSGRPMRLRAAAGMMVPKLIVLQLLRPALSMENPIELVCHEGALPELLSKLAVHQLDVVFSDGPMGSEFNVRAFNHLLGRSSMTLFAPPNLSRSLRRNFPQSLEGAPLLLPLTGTAVRRQLEMWLDYNHVRVRPVGEFADSALIKVLGQNGLGAFVAPTVIAENVESQFGCKAVAEIPEIHEEYYAITVERRIRHPGVVAICETAKDDLFNGG